MRYHELIADEVVEPRYGLENQQADLADLNRPGVGCFDEERLANLVHHVEQYGLGEDKLVDLANRREWCADTLSRDYQIEPMRENGRLVGRVFRFKHPADAVLFKMMFHGVPYGDRP